MKVKEKSEKVGLKLNIQKTKIMASSPITPWEIDGETVETVVDFIFLSSKITADDDCSHEIKRRLLLGRKVMTNLDSIFFFIVLFFIFYFFLNFKIFNSYMHSHRQHIKKQRYYFANKGLSSQSCGFSSSDV